MVSILSEYNVLTTSFPLISKVHGIGSLYVPWKMDRFIRVEDEVLVSHH